MPRDRGWRLFRGLAVSAAILTYLLIGLGGIVRVSGSGLGCGDNWPLCNGAWLPAWDLQSIIEYSHRFVAQAVAWLTLATVVVGWIFVRRRAALPTLATVALVLVAAQAILGARVVQLGLPPEFVLAHLGLAMACLAAMLIVATLSFLPARPVSKEGHLSPLPRLALTAAIGTYLLVFSGAWVTSSGAGFACRDWPLCSGGLLPVTDSSLQNIHILHRLVAATAGSLIVVAVVWVLLHHRRQRALLWTATFTGLALLTQIIVGALNVFTGLPPVLIGAHILAAAAVWSGTVILTVLAYRTALRQTQASSVTEGKRRAIRETARDYLSLTKPRVAVLLLLATIGAMALAAGGMPDPGLLLWTALGGFLAAGGASALNQVIDKDIDALMERTKRRPVAAGRVRPEHAELFGMLLGAASAAVFATFVNGLAAFLAMLGFLFYVIIYSYWLKRLTPQNIVIGGAAGAFPALVGWAAVTGNIGMPALIVFAIIFFWTPPHFWALALLKKNDYARAGVPMLPVVAGEAATRRQILGYTLLLVAITFVPAVARDLGLIYLASAMLLGAVFVALALSLLRRGSPQTARRLFSYSNAYLALLLLGMVLDHSLLS